MRRTFPAVFARGGTSKGLIVRVEDLPADRTECDELLLAAMGSPDPSGRQLNGMGGGVSSLSKVCVVGPSTRSEADVDYTFAQVQVKQALVDWSGNCGNMASAIGPFAVEAGLVPAVDGETVVRIHNTNTGKVIVATFEVADGQAVEEGSLAVPGVSGTGAPVRLDFVSPGGAATGRLLPTGAARDRLPVDIVVPGRRDSGSTIEVSLVDVANACVFVRASDLGLTGTELPGELESRPEVLSALAEIRAVGSVAMGITATVAEARAKPLVPLVALISGPQRFTTLAGEAVGADEMDLTIRMISNGQPHRAVPITGGLCAAVASRLPGSIAAEFVREHEGSLRLGMPSGVIQLESDLSLIDGTYAANSGSIYRTTRRLFAGIVSA